MNMQEKSTQLIKTWILRKLLAGFLSTEIMLTWEIRKIPDLNVAN